MHLTGERGGDFLIWAIRDVPLDRVWSFWPRSPKQGLLLRTGRFNPDYEQSLSFPSLREVRFKEHAIERRTSG